MRSLGHKSPTRIWHHFGTTLTLLSDHFGTTPAQFGTAFRPHWHNFCTFRHQVLITTAQFGTTFRQIWHHFGNTSNHLRTILAPCRRNRAPIADHFPTGSAPLRHNLAPLSDHYPFTLAPLSEHFNISLAQFGTTC